MRKKGRKEGKQVKEGMNDEWKEGRENGGRKDRRKAGEGREVKGMKEIKEGRKERKNGGREGKGREGKRREG